MTNFVVFLASQFFALFSWLDSIILFSNISLLKIMIIILLFTIAFNLLRLGGGKSE